MKLKPEWKAERDRYVAKFPLPQKLDAESDDVWTERLRQWSLHLAEQLAWKFPGEHLAVKRGDAGRPICKDCLAQGPRATLIAWDLMSAASSGHPTLNPDPDSLALGPGTPDGGTDGQFFEDRPEYFKPQDHIGAVPQPPKPPPIPPQPPVLIMSLADYFAFRDDLVKVYREELGRDVAGDPDAIVNWTYHWREGGQPIDWIRARVRESPEWKAKHPNG